MLGDEIDPWARGYLHPLSGLRAKFSLQTRDSKLIEIFETTPDNDPRYKIQNLQQLSVFLFRGMKPKMSGQSGILR